MKKIILIILLTIFLASCQMQEDSLNINSPTKFFSGEEVFIQVKASQFTFDPNIITVNEGDKVTIELTSTDVGHGLAIPDYGVNIGVSSGETKRVSFVADKKGNFKFYCSVFCGPGHGRMSGTLIVQ